MDEGWKPNGWAKAEGLWRVAKTRGLGLGPAPRTFAGASAEVAERPNPAPIANSRPGKGRGGALVGSEASFVPVCVGFVCQ